MCPDLEVVTLMFSGVSEKGVRALTKVWLRDRDYALLTNVTEVVIMSSKHFVFNWSFFYFFHTKIDLLPGFLYALGRKRNIMNNSFHTVYKEIFAPRFILTHVVAGKFNTEQI